MPRAFSQVFTSPSPSLPPDSSRAQSGCLRVFPGLCSSFVHRFGCAIPDTTKPILAILYYIAGYQALLQKVISQASLFQIFSLSKQNNNNKKIQQQTLRGKECSSIFLLLLSVMSLTPRLGYSPIVCAVCSACPSLLRHPHPPLTLAGQLQERIKLCFPFSSDLGF